MITKDMGITEIVNNYPETLDIFAKYNLGCIGCMASHFETLEQGLTAHGLNVDAIVAELNEVIKK